MNAGEVNRPDLAAVASYLRIVSHPSRLAIALLLLEEPHAVSGIESALGLRQPNLSQHLGVLRDANILTASRQAKSVTYTLCDGPARELVLAISAAVQSAGSRSGPAGQASAPVTVPTARAPAGEPDDALMFAQVLTRRPVEPD